MHSVYVAFLTSPSLQLGELKKNAPYMIAYCATHPNFKQTSRTMCRIRIDWQWENVICARMERSVPRACSKQTTLHDWLRTDSPEVAFDHRHWPILSVSVIFQFTESKRSSRPEHIVCRVNYFCMSFRMRYFCRPTFVVDGDFYAYYVCFSHLTMKEICHFVSHSNIVILLVSWTLVFQGLQLV